MVYNRLRPMAQPIIGSNNSKVKKMKSLCKFVAMLYLMLCIAPFSMAQGWPSNYEGVMLQGFYWDSYSDTKWTKLTSQADELSEYFSLIWIPNSGYCGGGNNMGYMPQYWFKHTSSFGNDTELRTMITTFKEKGTGFIADVVINHRNGVTNWTDFPTETDHKGKTWSWGAWAICKNDEVANASGQAKPTGANDTGDNFDGCRDLDHTNTTVQEGIKAYLDYLLNDLGYVGFRYDMVKGYSASYTGIYNEASKPTYSVGEYWDGSYDAVTGWVEGTKRNNQIQSAAFDFPCKYAINEAFASNDYSKLVWARWGTNKQPAGLIHMDGYTRYAITFVDNHDTYRDGSKFNGNVVAANAFILCSPGTPCVFLPHWKSYKSEIKKLIAVRNAVGVNNQSVVTVLESATDIYAAKVTGTNGSLVIKIGPRQYTPSGYTSSDIAASGTDYCVWTTTDVNMDDVGGDEGETNDQQGISIYLEKGSAWSSVYYYAWTDDGELTASWPGTMVSNSVTVDGTAYYKYTFDSSIKSLNVIFNNGTDQTVDITGVTEDTFYRLDSQSGKTITVTVLDVTNTGGEDVPQGPISVYLEKASAWSKVNYYAWTDAGELLGTWPGTAITQVVTDTDGKEDYVYTFPETIESLNIIFNNGTDQTIDIENVSKTTYYRLNELSGKTCGVTDITENISTAVDGVASYTQCVVYPNPVINHFVVRSPEIVKCVRVYDLNGAIVRCVQGHWVDVQDLVDGVYLYSVELANGVVERGKFIKQ